MPNNTIIREQNERQEHDSYMGLSNKWVSAIHLKKGDRVLLSDDTYAIIQSVTTLHLSTPETTYNFEVEDYHTYFVGNGVCVHNTCERAAMRAAKRSENIPMNQKPDKVIIEETVRGANGRNYQPKTQVFGDKFIRNDLGGHIFPDGATLGSHFNAGKIINGRFVQNKIHFFYGG